MSMWWRDHADHICASFGPGWSVLQMRMEKHRDPEHLELKKAPTGWFPRGKRPTALIYQFQYADEISAGSQ